MTEDVYCTLLLSDDYLPGAQVLAHSLRDGGTTKKLAILVVNELRLETITELERLYDYVIPTPRVIGRSHANLLMLNRPELNDTFTKINLWKQTQFSKIVYIDADVLVIRPPDELFQLNVPFAAAPDIGWPDCFNSGVMLLQPNFGIYNGLLRLSEQGQSFDGADQGLLNEYFRNWHRLSFTYNCTPSSSYQYIPAYRHFESQISMVHFIGSEKPWTKVRSSGSTWAPYDKLLGRWWSVWDRNYAPIVQSTNYTENGKHQQHWHSEQGSSHQQESSFQPSITPPQAYYPPGHNQETSQTPHALEQNEKHNSIQGHHVTHDANNSSGASQQVHYPASSVDLHSTRATFTIGDMTYTPLRPTSEGPQSEAVQLQQSNWTPVKSEGYVPPFVPPQQIWDPTRSPPPVNSAPEAGNLVYSALRNKWDMRTRSSTERKLSQITKLVKSANISDEPPVNLKPVFPWEQRAKAPTRVFTQDNPASRAVQPKPDRTTFSPVHDERDAEGYKSASEVTLDSEEEEETEQEYSEADNDQAFPQWRDYVPENLWDSVPEISNYISALRHRNRIFKPVLKVNAQNGINFSSGHDDDEDDRIPLPLTPNPLRRRNLDEDRNPRASGVPAPTQWDPYAKLSELRAIPTSFLVRQNKGRNSPRLDSKPSPGMMQSSAEAQTDISLMNSNSAAQTEEFRGSEQSTQWQRNEWVEDKSTQTKQTEVGREIA